MTRGPKRPPFDHGGTSGSQGHGTNHNCGNQGRGSHGWDSQGHESHVIGSQGRGCGQGVSGSRPSISGAANGSGTVSGSGAASGSIAKSRPIPIHPPIDPVLHEVFESMFAEFTNAVTSMLEIPRLTAIWS
ncbi:hypothetical protein R1flu_001622 [Riccia fluitans]|uniref:Uncharacterized protein n=1 Tax=Riccia fluitans TaxID=41844 RepID=A0ABD1Y3U2_9MARC